MNPYPYKLTKIAAILLGGTLLGSGIAPAQENGDTNGAEVLTRGPVHEAFAGTVIFNPEAGIIVDQAPPELIEEVPPEQRLAGDNVAWIPGYWAWDEDQSDFLWISGIWRNLPPGREWIPGYWAEVEGRHQWTSGYWEDAQAAEITYLPKPPRSVEAGPNIEASSNDQTWIPGNWVYRDSRYAWRAGYWVNARENWSWTPAYYRWSNRGYVYVNGYWDYPVVQRGVVFAPVRFNRGYISRPGFYYSPLTVVSLSVFTNHLFLRPNYGHYYFGDYYEPRYRDRGFFASYSYSSRHRGYDPIYAHQRWVNRNDRNWDRQRQDYYEYRRDNADARPPRTWAALNSRSQQDRDRGDFGVAERFDRVVDDRGEGKQRFQKVDAKEREQYVSQRQEIRKFGKEREQLETTGERVRDGDNDKAQALSVKSGRSPVVARKSDRDDKDGGPPERLQPRMSDKNQGDEQNGRNDGAKSDRNDDRGDKAKSDEETRMKPGQKRDDQSQGDSKDEPGSKSNANDETRTMPGQKREDKPQSDRQDQPGDKGKSDEETRTKPGQKREDKPQADRQDEPGGKGKSNEETRTIPGQKREDKPQADRQDEPGGKGKSNEETRTIPGQKREDKPQADRQDQPGGKGKSEEESRTKPGQKREDNSNQERKAAPEPRRESQPTPERKARPEPERKAMPEQERKSEPKVKPIEQPRESSNASARKSQEKATVQAEPKRRQQPEPQLSRKSSESAPAVETRKKGKAASESEETNDGNTEGRKKKQKDG